LEEVVDPGMTFCFEIGVPVTELMILVVVVFGISFGIYFSID
jgi:hypothetical protein